MDDGVVHVVVVGLICFAIIVFRCGYRLLCHCSIHTSCHRTWHQDDLWMALAVLPLAGRSVCVALYTNILANPNPSDAGRSVALKLLIPSRLCYALFEWCMKLCIVSFYFRIRNGTRYMEVAPRVMFWFICLTYVGVVLATLLECRPLSLAWIYIPDVKISCQKALANLLTMAVSNIVTDIMLVILPIPALLSMTMSRTKKAQVILLFSMGIIVVCVTIARLPLIISDGIPQRIRSLWASIEMAVSCLVANFIFYYVLFKDVRYGHAKARSSLSAAQGRSSFSSQPSVLGLYHADKFTLTHIER